MWRVVLENGYLQQVKQKMETKLPGCDYKQFAHIESLVKSLKQKYHALSDMSSLVGLVRIMRR